MHAFRLPLRWSDLDTLNHVNNVRMLDYAAEARAELLAEGVLTPDAGPTSIDVSFLAPLELARREVEVRSEVDAGAVMQEISSGEGDDRVVHVRLRRGPSDGPDPSWPGRAVVTSPTRLRLTDAAADGVVTEAQIAELFQESRIQAFWGARGTAGGRLGPFAVARIVQHYAGDLPWSAEPVVLGSVVPHLGTKSALVHAALTAGGRCVATTEVTVVAFDPAAQGSRVIDDSERAVLAAVMCAPVSD